MTDSKAENLPDVYVIKDISMEDRIAIYKDEILPNVKCSQVYEAMLSYVSTSIEPLGWEAVWRSTSTSTKLCAGFDFLVEVLDVSHNKLEADVKIIRILPTSETTDSEVDAEVLDFVSTQMHAAPLVELYPTYDESKHGQFDKTAEILENVRFFYEHIWRPWDEEEEEDYIYVDRHLISRIVLFYDLKKGILAPNVADSIQQTLAEAFLVHEELQMLQTEMHVSDSEDEVDENFVVRCLKLNQNLEELKRKLQLLENPLLRTIITRQNLLQKSIETLHSRDNNENVVHIVANTITAEVLKDYLSDLPPTTVVEYHKSFPEALVSTYDGDTILIHPGIYACENLGWLDDSVTIKGLGKNSTEVVLQGEECGDIFLTCNARSVSFQNLTLKSNNNTMTNLMIHHGFASLDNCRIEGGKLAIRVLTGAEIKVIDSFIEKASLVGVHLSAGSSAELENNHICDCGKAGIVLQMEQAYLSTIHCPPTAVIKSNTIEKNSYGIILSKTDNLLRSEDLNITKGDNELFDRFEHKIEYADNVLEKNMTCNIAIFAENELPLIEAEKSNEE